MMKAQQRIIRKPEVLAKVGVSDATVRRLELAGRFPKRLRLGPNSVGWLSTEVDEWIERKAGCR